MAFQLTLHAIAYLPVTWIGMGRLHDVGAPGWLAVFPPIVLMLLPHLIVVGAFASLSVMALVKGHPILFDAALFRPMPGLLYFPAAGMVVMPAIYTIYKWCLPGQKDANRYGPPPRALFNKA